MRKSYNGFTGELVKLEAKDLRAYGICEKQYDLSIYDNEKGAAISFTGVKLADVKFHGGAVSFGE